MSGTHKKVLWVEVILSTAGRQKEWILCWGPYSIWIHFICACPLSSGHVESRAVADGSFQETTGPKGIPLCCAFSIQTTKAGCGPHTLVKGAKIVSAGCPTDCRQAEERAEHKPTCEGEGTHSTDSPSIMKENYATENNIWIFVVCYWHTLTVLSLVIDVFKAILDEMHYELLTFLESTVQKDRFPNPPLGSNQS